MHTVPDTRVRPLNAAPIRPDARHVLYWMVASRRTGWNFGLQRAVDHARALGLPLIVLEALRVGYRWASDRHHAFVLDGMADNRRRLADAPVTYFPYVEPAEGAGRGLLEALMGEAALVVTDDYPAFFIPRMIQAAADRAPVLVEAIDANGLYPMRATERVFTVAHSFRRHLQRELPDHLRQLPAADPLAGVSLPVAPVPSDILARWPEATDAMLAGELLWTLPIDHGVAPVEALPGGTAAAQARWRAFLAGRLARYAEGRNDPSDDPSTGLSPYLHFGHIGVHQLFEELARAEGWTLDRVSDTVHGKREGWWGMSPGAEAFLDELVTWREVGFNCCALTDDFDKYSSLPEWARVTLEAHRDDERATTYTLEDFEQARTHDPIWNAAQRQLLREGRIHNYLRMLWGKKILHWSATPQEALEVMIHLNNRYALDGRDPNSYSGIFWCLGRYDRAWGPERPIFGKVRYMSSESTARKLDLRAYLKTWGPTRAA